MLADYSRDLPSAKWGSGSICTAAILSRQCPLWVKSRHRKESAECPLYPRKRTSIEALFIRAMRAGCRQRAAGGRAARHIVILR